MSFEKVKRGVVKRTQRREIGIFIDGVNLDRASRRLNRKIDFAALLKSLSGGLTPKVARYYSVIPNEDDSRHHAFLDVVYRAGFEIIVKRLPPVGIDRQVTTDVEIGSDLVAFALGRDDLQGDDFFLPDEHISMRESILSKEKPQEEVSQDDEANQETPATKLNSIRVVTVVAPGRDLGYSIGLAHKFGADTITADFSNIATGDKMKSAAKWIDLADSEAIWRL